MAPQSSAALVVVLATLTGAWVPPQHQVANTHRPLQSRRAQQRTVVHMGGRAATPLGRQSTPEGKRSTVGSVGTDMAEASLIFAFPGDGLDIKKLNDLRGKLPETSKARMVKNTLFQLAGKEQGWSDATLEAAEPMFHGSNLWIFSGEDMRGTINAYEDWLKDQGLKEGYDIKGGFMEGTHIDPKGVKGAIDLPTKPELMARLAGAINMAGPLGIATKLKNAKGNAQGLAVRLKQAAGTKLAKAIKLSVGDEEKNPN